ncbi:MAG: hypothetical protein AAFR12_01165 [Cyanobacteria bacterium J06626_6]
MLILADEWVTRPDEIANVWVLSLHLFVDICSYADDDLSGLPVSNNAGWQCWWGELQHWASLGSGTEHRRYDYSA